MIPMFIVDVEPQSPAVQVAVPPQPAPVAPAQVIAPPAPTQVGATPPSDAPNASTTAPATPPAATPAVQPSAAPALHLREEPVPRGKAAPPTAAAAQGQDAQDWRDGINAGLEVFAQYQVRETQGSWFHEFELPRMHAALEGRLDAARARVVAEAVRSTAEGALVGVSGDSVLLRVREAFVSYTGWKSVTVSAGVVPTLTIPELDGTWMLRVVSISTLEQAQASAPSDLGATVHVQLPRAHGVLAVGAFNGEGYTRRELNRGKNLEATASVHPFASLNVPEFAVFLGASSNALGVDSIRSNRFSGGLLWQGEALRAGLSAHYLNGVPPNGAQDAFIGEAFVRASPVKNVLLGARGTVHQRDLGTPDRVVTVTVSTGYQIAAPLEIHLIGARSAPTERTQVALPESDFWEGRIALRGRL